AVFVVLHRNRKRRQPQHVNHGRIRRELALILIIFLGIHGRERADQRGSKRQHRSNNDVVGPKLSTRVRRPFRKFGDGCFILFLSTPASLRQEVSGQRFHPRFAVLGQRYSCQTVGPHRLKILVILGQIGEIHFLNGKTIAAQQRDRQRQRLDR